MRNMQALPLPQRPAVLLVDDARIVLRVVERTLTTAGFTLSVAESAEEALRLLDDQEFACALIDRNLIGADGLDLIKQIRTIQPRCACIVMTAYPSVASAVEALRLGVADYIQKPSPDFDRIAQCVQDAIRLHRERESAESADGADPVADRRRQLLIQSAEEIVVTLKSLQGNRKFGGGALKRALAVAEAHAKLLRRK